jgi:hypothetical protein
VPTKIDPGLRVVHTKTRVFFGVALRDCGDKIGDPCSFRIYEAAVPRG